MIYRIRLYCRAFLRVTLSDSLARLALWLSYADAIEVARRDDGTTRVTKYLSPRVVSIGGRDLVPGGQRVLPTHPNHYLDAMQYALQAAQEQRK